MNRKFQNSFVVVDAANVAFDPSGVASLARLSLVKQALDAMGCKQVAFIADASLRHRMPRDDAEHLEEMIRSKELYQAPAASSADEFIIDLARRKDGFIVSNDLFREHVGRWKLLWSRRVSYLIIGDEVLFSSEPSASEAEPSRVAAPANETSLPDEIGMQPAGARDMHETSGEEEADAGGKEDQRLRVYDRLPVELGRDSPYDTRFAADVQPGTPSYWDEVAALPFISVFGGFCTATVWIVCLTGIFVPLFVLGTSPLGLSLAVLGAVILLPLGTGATFAIARWYLRNESINQANANEGQLRAYTAVSLLMWVGGAILLSVSVAGMISGLVMAGLILATGPAYPLIGFIRSAKRFQQFTTWADAGLVGAVCITAVCWLAGEALGVYYLFASDLAAIDRALFVTVLALLAVEALVVLGRWALPLEREAALS